jgi:penicillin-binding protein 1B
VVQRKNSASATGRRGKAGRRSAGNSTKGRGSRRAGRLLGRWVLLLFVAGGLAAGLYGVYLDGKIRAKFEGKRWALPARVYSRPLELYAGRPLTAAFLQEDLNLLRYRRVSDPRYAGTYARSGDRFLVHTRAFRFWDGPEAEHVLDIEVTNGQVAALKNAAGGGAPALVRLDPVLIASIYPADNEDRVLVSRKELPDLLVKTLLAVEDRDFYHHYGIDPVAILRALWRDIKAGQLVEGGSTLTQQLVKNFYLSQARTIKRKVEEAVMAVLLDRRYSKDEILDAYANEIFLGQDGRRAIHGFGLASLFYFNRPLNELTIPETALLVGLIKGPSYYDPRRHPARALARRNLVIDTIAQQGVITPEQARKAKAAPLGVSDKGGRPAGSYPAFLQLVRRQLQRDYREEDLRTEGLRIFTTLDPLVQAAAERAVSARLPELERERHFKAGTLEAAAIVASPAEGEVLAVVGGRDSDYAGFNRALDAVRSIGSLVKPAVYLTALSMPQKYSLVTTLSDTPVSIRAGDGKLWQPENYSRKVHGPVPLYFALAHSFNLATVHLGLSLGVDRVADTLARLGVERHIDAVPSLLLGSVSLTPADVAQVYQTLANGGFRAPLRAIRDVLDASGRPLSRYPLAVQPVADANAVYLTTWAMQQVVKQGTATYLLHRLPASLTVAGKTGTTNDLRDSWFAGFSGDKVTVVWVGRDDNKSARLTGASGALRVWGDIMANIENRSLPDLVPDGITDVRVDPSNGLLAAGDCGRALTVPFESADVPTRTSTCGAAQPPSATPAKNGSTTVAQEKGLKSVFGEFMRGFLGN